MWEDDTFRKTSEAAVISGRSLQLILDQIRAQVTQPSLEICHLIIQDGRPEMATPLFGGDVETPSSGSEVNVQAETGS